MLGTTCLVSSTASWVIGSAVREIRHNHAVGRPHANPAYGDADTKDGRVTKNANELRRQVTLGVGELVD